MRHLQLARSAKSTDVLRWLQKVTFAYTFLCLFDDIRSSIHDLLSKVILVDEIYDPISIHKCIIVPRYAIGAYFSTLHQTEDLDKTIQNQTNPVGRRQTSIFILYTNKYIVKYFKFLSTIEDPTLMALEKKKFYNKKSCSQKFEQRQCNILQRYCSKEHYGTERFCCEDRRISENLFMHGGK